jgi:hypothetical protein
MAMLTSNAALSACNVPASTMGVEARLRKSDRPKVDPFAMHDAETLIAAIHHDWGETPVRLGSVALGCPARSNRGP